MISARADAQARGLLEPNHDQCSEALDGIGSKSSEHVGGPFRIIENRPRQTSMTFSANQHGDEMFVFGQFATSQSSCAF